MTTQKNNRKKRDRGPRTGKLFVVGIGSGAPEDRTKRAEATIRGSDVVAGYAYYLAQVTDLTKKKELISSGMRHEKERVQAALERAQAGAVVSLISSGDAGIYGMAGLAIEMAAAGGFTVPVEVIPGVSAALTAAARLGAPLSLDYACISLSDLLVPWKMIVKRLKAVAKADLVTALYNPRSTKRVTQLDDALCIFRQHRKGSTPVGLGKNLGTPDEIIIHTDLDNLDENDVDMRTVVIIGNRSSRLINNWFVTPRGYVL